MNPAKLKDQNVAFMIWNTEKEDDVPIYLGKLRGDKEAHYFVNEENGWILLLNPNRLDTLKPVADDLTKKILLNADYALSLGMEDLPQNHKITKMTGIKGTNNQRHLTTGHYKNCGGDRHRLNLDRRLDIEYICKSRFSPKLSIGKMKKIFVINGSASDRSSNQKLIDNFANLTKDFFTLTVFNGLKTLPHFDPQLSMANTPEIILDFRHNIEIADGILICTPEYVFSIPSGLKNAIEWCVSTTIFTDKPLGMITASANGEKGHQELQLIMKTVMTKFTVDTTLLIQGVKGKINKEGHITDHETNHRLTQFITAFKKLTETECP